MKAGMIELVLEPHSIIGFYGVEAGGLWRITDKGREFVARMKEKGN